MQDNIIGDLLWVLLVTFIIAVFLSNFLKKEKYCLFSPIMFFLLYLVYYVVIPYTKGHNDVVTGKLLHGEEKLLFGTILMLVSFLIAFTAKVKRKYFEKTISIYKGTNIATIALSLFILAFVANGIFSGFSLTFIAEQEYSGEFNEQGSYNHVEMYLTYLVSLFPASICVMLAIKKKWTALVMLVVASAIYLIGGFRFRLLVMFVPIFLMVHLYPKPRRINWKLWLPLALVFYIGMGIIESTRTYGGGLDIEKVQSISEGDLSDTSSKENMMVYCFSAQVMDKYSNMSPILFTPIATAVLMPIPRVLFPWKPDGMYMRDANIAVYQTITYGSAFLNITEAYMSFGWFGIVLYGLLLGYISKIFWVTYLRNKNSIAAIILLGSFNGMLYIALSRGYMAQDVTYYVYYILIFCWLSRCVNAFLNKRSRKKVGAAV